MLTSGSAPVGVDRKSASRDDGSASGGGLSTAQSRGTGQRTASSATAKPARCQSSRLRFRTPIGSISLHVGGSADGSASAMRRRSDNDFHLRSTRIDSLEISPSSMRTKRSAFAITGLSCVEKMNVVPKRAVDLLHQLQNFLAGCAVEIGGRLVGQYDRGPDRQRARDGHALPLAAAQLVRAMMRVLATARRCRGNRATRFLRSRRSRSGRCSNGYSTFSAGRQHRQQVERLEDETDRPCAQVGELVRRAAADVPIVDVDLAACRRVDAADEVEQRRLAAARGPGDAPETRLARSTA